MWGEIYDRLAELALQHRSTLVFVNTRRLAERLALHLGERLGEDQVAAHHGSLARKLRLTAERKLKNGEIRLLVATASLELGIDIGTVDLVCQINSPRAIAVALQRVGAPATGAARCPRDGCSPPRATICWSARPLVRAIRQGDLDRCRFRRRRSTSWRSRSSPCAPAKTGTKMRCSNACAAPIPIANSTRSRYDRILEMLSQGIAAKRGRYGAYLFRDMVNRRLRARRGARLAAITSGGAIPETALFTVVAQPEEIVVGTVDEDFAVESNAGDIMLLGNTSWRIRRVENNTGRVLVEDAHGAPPDDSLLARRSSGAHRRAFAARGELRERISALMPNTAPLHR